MFRIPHHAGSETDLQLKKQIHELNPGLHWYMDFTAGYIDDLKEKLNIRRLGYYGVTDADLDHITESTDHKANPVTFEQWQLSEMLRKRL